MAVAAKKNQKKSAKTQSNRPAGRLATQEELKAEKTRKKNQKTPKQEIVVIPKNTLRKYLVFAAVAVTAIVVLFLVWQILDARSEVKKLSDPSVSTQNANEKLIKEVEAILIVPKDEKPTIAEITDRDKQKGNAFFAEAQNQDKVLVYQKASKVILYRPSTKQIVNIANLDAGQTSTPSTTNPAAAPTAPVPAQ